MAKKYKILSLDGGGSWALLQSMALENLYRGTNIGTRCGAILNEFDIIVANSGGSLMLAAMIENVDKDISEVTKMFLNDQMRQGVFSPLNWYEKNIIESLAKYLGFGPKYKTSRKIDGIRSALPKTGDMLLREIPLRRGIKADIVICGFDYDRNRSVFFRSNQNSSSQANVLPLDYTLAQCVHGASNAPVKFFDEPAKFNIGGVEHQIWDGAVGGNNNPVLIALTEAFAILPDHNRHFQNLLVLSIGTGNNLLPVRGFTKTDGCQDSALLSNPQQSKFSKDVAKMANSIVSEPPDAANYMAHMFLGGSSLKGSDPGIVRLNPLLQPIYSERWDQWQFPIGMNINEREVYKRLIDLEMDAVKSSEVNMIEQLGQMWVLDRVPNQPVRVDSQLLTCNIGHHTFGSGKTDWLKRCGIS